MGTSDFMSTGSISGINGYMRSYTLTNLEEDSEHNITVTAMNGAGSATSTVWATKTSGACMSV